MGNGLSILVNLSLRVASSHSLFGLGRPFAIQRRGASGPPLGKRWVAGKVVNESYGAAKQQHTFTVSGLRGFQGCVS